MITRLTIISLVFFLLAPLSSSLMAQDSDASGSFKVNVELPVPWVDYHKKRAARQKEETRSSGKRPARTSFHPGHWHGFYFHFSNLATSSMKINQFSEIELHDGRSYGWSLNGLQASTALNRSKSLLVVTGVGYDWNKYRFSDGISIQSIAGTSQIVPNNSDVLTSIIKTQYITIPLMLDWQFNSFRHKKTFLALGVQGNFNTRSLSRIHYRNGFGEILRQDINSLHFRFFRPDMIVQFGVGKICFHTTFALQSMFKGGKGPEMHPISFGIRLIPFE